MSTGQKIISAARELYHLIKSSEYDDALTTISKSYERFDHLDSAIDWALSRDPYQLDPIDSGGEFGNAYLWKSEKLTGFPQLRIIFTVDEEMKTVHLLHVEEMK